jgi:ABC-2 type transport system permease protein
MRRRRIRAIFRKELREFRRNKQIVSTMMLSPIGFLVAPLIFLFKVPASDASTLYDYPVLLFTLALAAMVPVTVGAYSITGERVQGTLEPVLGTPVLAREFLFGKALAVFVPSVAESYLVFGVIDALVWMLRPAALSEAALRPLVLLAQLIFTPLLAWLAVWVSMTISARVSDVRAGQQISTVIMLPVIALSVLFGFHVLHATPAVGITVGAVLVALDVAGLLVVSAAFDRERLVLGTR